MKTMKGKQRQTVRDPETKGKEKRDKLRERGTKNDLGVGVGWMGLLK